MNKINSPKKPLLYYYGLVMLVLTLFNMIAYPYLSEKQIKNVDYGTFIEMI